MVALRWRVSSSWRWSESALWVHGSSFRSFLPSRPRRPAGPQGHPLHTQRQRPVCPSRAPARPAPAPVGVHRLLLCFLALWARVWACLTLRLVWIGRTGNRTASSTGKAATKTWSLSHWRQRKAMKMNCGFSSVCWNLKAWCSTKKARREVKHTERPLFLWYSKATLRGGVGSQDGGWSRGREGLQVGKGATGVSGCPRPSLLDPDFFPLWRLFELHA